MCVVFADVKLSLCLGSTSLPRMCCTLRADSKNNVLNGYPHSLLRFCTKLQTWASDITVSKVSTTGKPLRALSHGCMSRVTSHPWKYESLYCCCLVVSVSQALNHATDYPASYVNFLFCVVWVIFRDQKELLQLPEPHEQTPISKD